MIGRQQKPVRGVRLLLTAVLVISMLIIAACGSTTGVLSPDSRATAFADPPIDTGATGDRQTDGQSGASGPAIPHEAQVKPDHEEPAPDSIPPGPHQPNEQGRIPILLYHRFGPDDGRWTRSYEGFRQDLTLMYERGFRPVSLADVVNRTIDLPKGYSPVVLSFDDGSAGQFRLKSPENHADQPITMEDIDPESAIGIMLTFHQEHPDWKPRGTFFVNAEPFGDRQTWQQKVVFLNERGYEVENHTWSHTNLSQEPEPAALKEIDHLQEVLTSVRGTPPTALALPFGAGRSRVEAWLSAGHHWQSSINSMLLVGSHPAPSPFSEDFDPLALPRIQVVDPAMDLQMTWYDWLNRWQDHENFYVSAGASGQKAAAE